MIINLTLVDIFTSTGNSVEGKTNFTVTPETAWHICAYLVGVASILIGNTFINVWKAEMQAEFLLSLQSIQEKS